MKKKLILFAAIIVVAAVYLIYKLFLVKENVEFARLEKGKLVTVVYATGNVSADSLATLRSETGGNIVFVAGKEGKKFRKGEVLLKTDQQELVLKIRQAENEISSVKVDLEDKKMNLERIDNLLKVKSVSQREYDNAKRDFDLTKIMLERKQLSLNLEKEKLSKSEIKAPYDCLIISSFVNIGDNLSINAECFKIISPASVLVEGEVDEQDIAKIKPGMKSIISFDAFAEKKFEAEVYRLIPKTDEATKTSKVLLKLNNKPDNLNIGMTATVNIVVAEKPDVIVVPKSSIFQKDKDNCLFVLDNDKLKSIKIEIGSSDGKYCEISGTEIKLGDLYLKDPKPNYKDGMRINPVIK